MTALAIYSLNHSAIGKTTHATGTAAAHVRYITRIQAKPDIVAHLIPENRNQARAWMNEQEASGRKNARVCDKLILALPVELTPSQRIKLLRDFADQITEGRAPYYGAIHASGKDEKNPHAHLILIDRDKDTGKRVMLTTEKGSTERFRERWEKVCNHHLGLAGEGARIDRRSLKAQGIDRTPQIHVGAEGEHINSHVARPDSKVREFSNVVGAKQKTRSVDYPKIDAGRTRQEFNNQIVDLNLETAKRSKDFGTRKRAELAQKLRGMTQTEEKRLADARRAITRQAREDRAAAWSNHRASVAAITEARDARLATVRDTIRAAFAVEWTEHFRQKAAAREGLKKGETFRRLSAKRSNSAIKAMKRGDDFMPGHLTQVFTTAAQIAQHRKHLRTNEIKAERDLRDRERSELKEQSDPIRAEAQQAYTAERSRYTAERRGQVDAVRHSWKDFHQQQAEAERARTEFAEKHEREISRIAEAISKTSPARWERSADREQSNTPPSFERPRQAPSLGRG